MRTTAAIAVAVLMCALSAMAEDAKMQLSVFTSNIGYTESGKSGSNLSGEAGIALSRAWTPRWSTELVLTAAGGRAYATRFTAYPVDLVAQYRFMNSSRWTPYVSGGIRYVAAPADPPSIVPAAIPGAAYVPVRPGFGFSDRASAEIGIGTALRLSPHFGLRFDGMRLLRSDSAPYDRLMRGSIGVNWRF